MKTYKEILNNKSTQQIRLITIHNILNDIDMNLWEGGADIFLDSERGKDKCIPKNRKSEH